MQLGSRLLCNPTRYLHEIHHPTLQQSPYLLQRLICRQPTLRHIVAGIQLDAQAKRRRTHFLDLRDRSLEKLYPLLLLATVSRRLGDSSTGSGTARADSHVRRGVRPAKPATTWSISDMVVALGVPRILSSA